MSLHICADGADPSLHRGVPEPLTLMRFDWDLHEGQCRLQFRLRDQSCLNLIRRDWLAGTANAWFETPDLHIIGTVMQWDEMLLRVEDYYWLSLRIDGTISVKGEERVA